MGVGQEKIAAVIEGTLWFHRVPSFALGAHGDLQTIRIDQSPELIERFLPERHFLPRGAGDESQDNGGTFGDSLAVN